MDLTADQMIDLVGKQMVHVEKMYELQTARLKAIGEYNKAVAEASVQIAKAQGMFIDNQRKIWSLQALNARRAILVKQLADATAAQKQISLKYIRSNWLIAGDQMTQNVMNAWTALYDLINAAEPSTRTEILGLDFSPSCTDIKNYTFLGDPSRNGYVPPKTFQPINSLQTLAYRMQYFFFAPNRGTPPHILVLGALRVLNDVTLKKRAAIEADIAQTQQELSEFLLELSKEGVNAKVPDPKPATA